MNFKEEPLLYWVGKVLMFNGIGGFIFTLFFDQIAGRTEVIYDWVQVMGLFSFGMLFIFGYAVDRFMTHDIIPMIQKYLGE